MVALDGVSGNQPATASFKQLEKILDIDLGIFHSKHQHGAVGAASSADMLAPLGAVLASLNECSLGKLLQAAKPFAVYCEGFKHDLLYLPRGQSRQALPEDMQATGKLLVKTMYRKQLRTLYGIAHVQKSTF
jgi:hypothetical protein